MGLPLFLAPRARGRGAIFILKAGCTNLKANLCAILPLDFSRNLWYTIITARGKDDDYDVAEGCGDPPQDAYIDPQVQRTG